MRQALALLWQYEFCWRLRRASGGSMTLADLKRAIDRLPHVEMPGADQAAARNRILAESLHAALYLLEDFGYTGRAVFPVLQSAFVASGGWLVRNDMRMWMMIDDNPFLIVAAQGPARLARRCHGEGLQVSEQRSADAVTVRVEQCPFQEYFWNAGRPELVRIMRAWDQNWMQVINNSDRPMRVSAWQADGPAGHYVIQFRNLAKRRPRRWVSPGIC